MTAGPRLPEAESPRSRGLLITVIILLVAVVALAVALVIALTGNDDADAPDAPIIGVTDPALTAPGDGSADVSPDTAPPAPHHRTPNFSSLPAFLHFPDRDGPVQRLNLRCQVLQKPLLRP